MEESTPEMGECDCSRHETPDRRPGRADALPWPFRRRSALMRIAFRSAKNGGVDPWAVGDPSTLPRVTLRSADSSNRFPPRRRSGHVRIWTRGDHAEDDVWPRWVAGHQTRGAKTTDAIGCVAGPYADCPNFGRHLHGPTGKGTVGTRLGRRTPVTPSTASSPPGESFAKTP